MSNSNPIGFFDSGVGGTSIWKEVVHLLPYEKSIYLADSANAPYGEKPVEEIIGLCKKNTELLLQKNCKLIVVACNTATTNAIKYLRENYPVPFIGIEPAIKPAALQSKTKNIGILATKGTLSSALFSKTSGLYVKNMHMIEVVGNGLVELIEKGKQNSQETEKLLRKLLGPMLKADIDYLVLGCSHYPYLVEILQKILPPKVSIIDSGEAVARQTQRILQNNNLLNEERVKLPVHQLYSNTNPEVLKLLVTGKIPVEISYLDF